VERAEKRIETDTDIRVLTTKKANRTKLGGEIVMRWANGRFVVDAASSAVQETADDAADETVFLALLAQFTKTGRNVSHNVAAPSYAPKQFLTTKAGSDLGKARLASAMARLFERHEIKVEIYGAPSKGYNRIIGVSREGL
jgi:RecA-family ATPase